MDAIDQLYEAAVTPELWGEALSTVSMPARTGQASLLIFREGVDPLVAGYNVDDRTRQEFVSRSWKTSPAVSWALRNGHAEFTPFTVAFTPEELAADRAVAQLYDLGLGDCLTSMLQLGDGAMAGFMFVRPRELGPYQPTEVAALDALRPHLARSALVSSRLAMEQAHSAVDALEKLGLAAAVIDVTGRVITSNPLLDSLTGIMIPTAFGGLALSDRLRNDRFRAALARVGKGANGPATSIPIPGEEDNPPMIVHLLPVRGQALDLFTGGHVLMVVSPVDRKAAPHPELLNGLFDLTAAEARLGRALLHGGNLSNVAARLSLSVHTVRVQLRSIMAKTGVHRQAELVQLLSSI